jgi:hypothetical protein
METFGHDLRFAARMLRRNAGFSLLIVGMLALALGANTALFSFADAILFRALPFANPERLVLVKGAAGTLVDMGFDQPEKFMQWNHTVQSLEYIAAYDSGRANLTDDRVPERIQVMRVSSDFFPMLGINPMKGRWFGQHEQQKGSNRVLILSHALWQSRYGGDAEILKKVVHLNGEKLPGHWRYAAAVSVCARRRAHGRLDATRPR